MPLFAGSVLFTEPVPDGVPERTASRLNADVYKLNPLESQQSPEPYSMDCVVVSNLDYWKDNLSEFLCKSAAYLTPDGHMILPVPNDWYSIEETANCNVPDYLPPLLEDPFKFTGLTVLGSWRERSCRELPMRFPGDQTPCVAVLTLVRPTYNPILHGCDLMDKGLFEQAYRIFKSVPEESVDDPETLASVHMECLRACAVQMQNTDRVNQLNLMWRAHYSFTNLLKIFPHLAEAYLLDAQMWADMGIPLQMTKHLCNVQAVKPSTKVAEKIEEYSSISFKQAPRTFKAPEWKQPDRMPRILLITPEVLDYGLDVLYDGLCTLLGHQNVTDYPCKNELHGGRPLFKTLAHYPSAANWPEVRLDLAEVIAKLDRREYDLLIVPNVPFYDANYHIDTAQIAQIVKAAGDIPICIVDEGDDLEDNRKTICDALGITELTGYFKREMIAGLDYGPRAFPLPYSYQDSRIPDNINHPRNEKVFWAGLPDARRNFYVNRIEQLLDQDLQKSYPQEEYAQRLQDSLIGISLPGWGYDTVRYWELPANGCLLMSEKLPTIIPYNFEDDVSAVFVQTATEMEERLAYYLSHPEKLESVALAGYEHLKKYHTSSERARQFLGWVYDVIQTKNKES